MTYSIATPRDTEALVRALVELIPAEMRGLYEVSYWEDISGGHPLIEFSICEVRSGDWLIVSHAAGFSPCIRYISGRETIAGYHTSTRELASHFGEFTEADSDKLTYVN